MREDKKLWIVTSAICAIFGCLLVYNIFVYRNSQSSFIEKVDDNGVVWVKLNHISDNTTVCVYYGDNVSSQRMWILK